MSTRYMLLAHSDVLMLMHVVFATRDRRPTLQHDRDRALHDDIRARLLRLRADPLAIGNASDHMHIVVSLHPSVPLAEVVRTVKGGSSYFLNCEQGAKPFAWQNGYWARSIGFEALSMVCDYVRDQRSRHARGAVDPLLEQNAATRVE